MPKGGKGGKGGRGGFAFGKRPVSEQNRISIDERLEQFRAGPDRVLTFENNLSNHDRAVVHQVSQKMGFKSKSSGKGSNRRVSVYKTGPSQKGQSHATPLSFSVETQGVLRELFSRYPPREEEFTGKTKESTAALKRPTKLDRTPELSFCKPSMTQSEIATQVNMLVSRLQKSPALQQIANERLKLPISSFKDTITSAVDSNQVVLIAGETGCGKTTQVPQFILDYMWSQGKACKLLCTQPRRISATSVAERIASERGEKIGSTVGYQIRLESKGGKHSSLMFCTNGVLLRRLIESGSQLSEAEAEGQSQKLRNLCSLDATHIIVDEIHERDRFCDFMLVILRDLLHSQPDLRLILMSATLDAEKFSKYFNNCPIIRIPGFTYPVHTYYLEDVLTLVGFSKDGKSVNNDNNKNFLSENSSSLTEEDRIAMDEAIGLAWLEDDFNLLMDIISGSPVPELCNYQHSLTQATALMVTAGKGRVDDVSLLLSFGADCFLKAQDGSTALEWAQRHHQDEAAELILKHIEEKSHLQSATEEAELLKAYMTSVNVDEVDVQLIEKLLIKICEYPTVTNSVSEPGAILIFLSGWEEISRCRERFQASPIFSNSTKYLILPLHSMVPSAEQKKVFKRPPSGVRKIVLSTNIAETAITIDDIVYVIDSGRMKEKSYDPYGNVSTLQTAWVSKASARQREGRAGRCQTGTCYHLFSKFRFAALPDYQVPEIKRTPLEELCLQVKLQNPYCNISEFISKAIDPPVDLAVRNAITVLQDIGALTHDEKLTELGKQLGSLPVHPSTSKMLLFAILMNCLDPALTLASVAGYREPFVLPMGPNEKKRAYAAKMDLIAMYGGYSDHLAAIAAFDRWKQAKNREQQAEFCKKYYVSHSLMSMLDGMRKQLRRELAQKGFIPWDADSCSLNAQHTGIVRAVIVSGLYPMVGTLLPPLPTGQKAVVQTARGEKVRIHPHSSNFRLVHYNKQSNGSLKSPLLVFDEVTRGESQVFIKNCTLFKPYPLLLLATEMVVAPLDPDDEMDDDEEDDEVSDSEEEDESLKTLPAEKQHHKIMSSPDKEVMVVIDRWFRFEATSLDAAQLYCLRERLSAAVLYKIKHPRNNLPPILGESVFAAACMLSYDGGLDVETPTKREHQDFHSRMMTVSDIRGGSSPIMNRISRQNGQRGGSSGTRTSIGTDADIYDDKGNTYQTKSSPGVSPGNRNPRGSENGLLQNGFSRNVRQLYVPVRDGRVAYGNNRVEHSQEIPVLCNDTTSKRPRGSR
ncbi:hypothetical protein SUGI_0814530 [Cryptomeria japonica]|uniref:DExH-box ATP-dependent RNA helicase DExH6 isoform X1 n=2 Tax=Cryptomeria japonica TaxID=3369 RepID=UPI002414AB35|nr:DExH-box ATP-dependent RNA helicase DExH6 isoform X1 [Cryptomeria japonica]GLJ39839.1 hypothetical protein SUGI_0814530 [Cryptomeria japonica]